MFLEEEFIGREEALHIRVENSKHKVHFIPLQNMGVQTDPPHSDPIKQQELYVG